MVGVVSVGRSVIGQNGIWDTVMAGMVIVVVLVCVFPPELDQTIVGYSGQGITVTFRSIIPCLDNHPVWRRRHLKYISHPCGKIRITLTIDICTILKTLVLESQVGMYLFRLTESLY